MKLFRGKTVSVYQERHRDDDAFEDLVMRKARCSGNCYGTGESCDHEVELEHPERRREGDRSTK